MNQRIGIFGGAFDPVHNGHVAIAQSFLASNLVHCLQILPTPEPPHKPGRKLAPFKHRFRMLQLAFESEVRVKVSALEAQLPAPSYTYRTLVHLKKTDPDRLYYLCLGEDSLAGFTSWYRYSELLQQVCLLVAGRPGTHSFGITEKVLERTIFVDHQPLAISSSSIRRSRTATAGNREMNVLPAPVRRYIEKNHLYRTDT